jgi:hypothetical protein
MTPYGLWRPTCRPIVMKQSPFVSYLFLLIWLLDIVFQLWILGNVLKTFCFIQTEGDVHILHSLT